MSNIELRHLEGVKGGMAVSDTEYITTAAIREMELGTQLFYSNGRQIVDQQQHIFEVLWDKATPAVQKILQIEKGVKPEIVDIISDPLRSRDIYIYNLNSAREEILLVIPSYNSFDIQKKMGLLKIINYLSKIYDIQIKMLLNYKNQPDEVISKFLFITQKNNTVIRSLEKNVGTDKQGKIAIVIIDKKILLILELKDDYQDNFEKSIKFLVYSNNKSIVLSNVTIFDELWEHADLVKQYKRLNEKLKLQEYDLEKQIENKTRDLLIVNDNLEKTNRELSKKEEKLRKSNEELIKADISKHEFISMISHELKTPLVPIKGYTEMLLKSKLLGELNEMQVKAIRSIYRNVEKQESLVEDILDVYKLEIGHLKLSKKEILISNLFNNVLKDSKFMTEEKQVLITTEIYLQTRDTVYCDEKRIEQVLSNLIKNSIDFVPEKEGKIILKIDVENSYTKFKQDNDNVISNYIFAVKDNGKGIPEEKIDNLFKKFYQVDSSITRKHGGSGLGLVICKGIIEAHGGRIWIDKKHSKGLCIKFTIPDYVNSGIQNQT